MWTITVDPSDPDVLYAGGYGGVFKSVDGGANWGMSSTGLPISPSVISIAVDPADGTRVFAALESNGFLDAWGVYRSADGGASWSPMRRGMVTEDSISDLVIDPSAPGTMYAAGNLSLYKVTQGQDRWRRLDAAPEGPHGMDVDPAHPDTLFVANDAGVHRTTDGGVTWQHVKSLDHGQSLDVAVDPVRTNRVYASLGWEGAVLRSLDGGTTWHRTKRGLFRQLTYSLAVDSLGRVYLGTANGVYINDGGRLWRRSSEGLPDDAFVGAIAVDRSNPGAVYVGTGRGAFKSVDRGRSWFAIVDGLSGGCFVDVAVGVGSPGTLYAVTSDSVRGVWTSPDGGSSWRLPGAGLERVRRFRDLEVDPFDPRIAYVGTDGPGQVYRTDDAGGSWVEADRGLKGSTVFALTADPFSPGVLYAGTYGGIYRTKNRGESWRLLGLANGAPVKSIAVDPSHPGVIWVGTGEWQYYAGAVYRSADRGETWERMIGLNEVGLAIAIHPRNAKIVYVSEWGDFTERLLRTDDGGAMWDEVEVGEVGVINSITIDPLHPQTMFVGGTRGLYISRDRGSTWRRFMRGLTVAFTFQVSVDTARRTLHAASCGAGVFQYYWP